MLGSGRGLEVAYDLAEDGLIEDLFLLGTPRHQGVRADEIDLTRNSLGVVECLADKPVAEQGGAPIAGDLDLLCR